MIRKTRRPTLIRGASRPAVEKYLLKAMTDMPVIDGHSHLPAESTTLQAPADLFTGHLLHLTLELKLAGMSAETLAVLNDGTQPLERRWGLFVPFWPLVRHTSSAAAVLRSITMLYGVADLTEANHRPLSAQVSKLHVPGVYRKILQERCHIRQVLTNVPPTARTVGLDSDLLRPIPQAPFMAFLFAKTSADLLKPAFAPDTPISSLDEYLEVARDYMHRAKEAGAVGFKMHVAEYSEPDRDAALEIFNGLKSGRPLPPPQVFPLTGFSAPITAAMPLYSYLADMLIGYAESEGLVLAVHTGFWSDFRAYNPAHMIPLLRRHPQARFDIYHLGYPYVREALMLGKGFANVWLNFSWVHYISQQAAIEALDEAIDLVPTNKVLAFGSDIGLYNVCGHLSLAKENLARVLARRICAKKMTARASLDLIRQWFYDNPRCLYRLDG